jgi:hypothetical protein
MILLASTDWTSQVIDVKVAFLKGTFEDREKLYIKIPEGF